MKEMIKEHGHIRSWINGKTPSVYGWLNRQKIKFRKGELQMEEIDKLKEIGAIK